MNANIKQFKVNDEIETPNGVGIMQGVMIEDGRQYVVIRHELNRMTQRPVRHCLTPKSLLDPPPFNTGLWFYDPTEVTHA